MRPLLLACLLGLTAWAAAPPAAAQDVQPSVPGGAAAPVADPGVVPYAIVVGSNAGGPGQLDLQFAERDARRVAEVLRELGGYPAANVRTVLAPDPERLRGAIDAVAAAVEADAAAGRRTLVFFYYSGHARATALVLGADEVPIDELRARIDALPATVKVVVLDACQSGAFTRTKGAEPAADFSFNSLQRLDAAGIAVMASSSESELSQESDFLEGSYFTHHLLVGLRGGGDRNRDGRVSLDEAYQYAYHQTLVATSQTAVGRQHVSLLVDLEGQGELTLTYPERADATLTLAAAIAGDVLVQRLPAQAVLAEVHKAAGAAFDVAIPAGEYRVLVRAAKVVHRCPVTVPSGGAATVSLDGCDEMPLVGATAKHAAPLDAPWSVEVALAVGGAGGDAFTRRLEAFGFAEEAFTPRTAITLEAHRRVLPYLALTGRLARLDTERWRRATESEDIEYSVTSHALTLGGRLEWRTSGGGFVAWSEAGAGVTWARDRLEDEEDRVETDDFVRPHLGAAAGFTLMSTWLDGVGLDLDARYLYAPTVDNLVGDTLDVGGLYVGLGVVYRP